MGTMQVSEVHNIKTGASVSVRRKQSSAEYTSYCTSHERQASPPALLFPPVAAQTRTGTDPEHEGACGAGGRACVVQVSSLRRTRFRPTSPAPRQAMSSRPCRSSFQSRSRAAPNRRRMTAPQNCRRRGWHQLGAGQQGQGATLEWERPAQRGVSGLASLCPLRHGGPGDFWTVDRVFRDHRRLHRAPPPGPGRTFDGTQSVQDLVTSPCGVWKLAGASMTAPMLAPNGTRFGVGYSTRRIIRSVRSAISTEDGHDKILVSSPWGGGIWKSTRSSFTVPMMVPNGTRFGGWLPNTADNNLGTGD